MSVKGAVLELTHSKLWGTGQERIFFFEGKAVRDYTWACVFNDSAAGFRLPGTVWAQKEF